MAKFIIKNKKGKKYYLHGTNKGKGNFYFAPNIQTRNLITNKDQLNKFKKEYGYGETDSGFIYPKKL